MTMTTFARQVAVIVLAGATVGCDRVTKHMAAGALAGAPAESFLADTIRLEYVENPGAFLSLGANLPPAARTALFTFGTALILIAMIGAAVRLRGSSWAFLGLSLYIAGGASNFADRVARGTVIDFMNVGVGPLRTGIFNVADVAIMVGIGVLIVVHVRRPPIIRREPPQRGRASHE
jgi:signal peptidase II